MMNICHQHMPGSVPLTSSFKVTSAWRSIWWVWRGSSFTRWKCLCDFLWKSSTLLIKNAFWGSRVSCCQSLKLFAETCHQLVNKVNKCRSVFPSLVASVHSLPSCFLLSLNFLCAVALNSVCSNVKEYFYNCLKMLKILLSPCSFDLPWNLLFYSEGQKNTLVLYSVNSFIWLF